LNEIGTCEGVEHANGQQACRRDEWSVPPPGMQQHDDAVNQCADKNKEEQGANNSGSNKDFEKR
jgi:hypothetical protein